MCFCFDLTCVDGFASYDTQTGGRAWLAFREGGWRRLSVHSTDFGAREVMEVTRELCYNQGEFQSFDDLPFRSKCSSCVLGCCGFEPLACTHVFPSLHEMPGYIPTAQAADSSSPYGNVRVCRYHAQTFVDKISLSFIFIASPSTI